MVTGRWGMRGRIRLEQSSKNPVADLVNRLKSVTEKEVFVGIPQEKATRKHPGSDKINNAELLYVLSHGARNKEMREEMDAMQNAGMAYSKAHQLYLQEHGSPLWDIPPRPVLEPAIKANKEPIARKLGKATNAALAGQKSQANAYLHEAGQLGENAAKGWFENPANNWPPNSPVTIKLKGSDSPNIDTGEMRQAITHIVDDRRD